MEVFLQCQIIITTLNSLVGSKIKALAMSSHVIRMGTMTSTCALPQASIEILVLVPDRLVPGTTGVMRRPRAVEIVLCTASTMVAAMVAETLDVGVEVEEMAIASEVPTDSVGAQVHVVKEMLCPLQDPN